jgi:hypothetical protein
MKFDKAYVSELLRSHLERSGWPLRRSWSLPKTYQRDQAVTPWFLATPLRLRSDVYVIDGAFGVLHKGFEASWYDHWSKSRTVGNTLPLVMHIQNLRTWIPNAYIREEFAQEDVTLFAESILATLDALPTDERSLVEVFRAGHMLGRALENWTGGDAQRAKFMAFREFVSRLSLQMGVTKHH